MTNTPKEIWLQPSCCAPEKTTRLWSEGRWEECDCPDPQPDVRYVLAPAQSLDYRASDIRESSVEEAALRQALERLSYRARLFIHQAASERAYNQDEKAATNLEADAAAIDLLLKALATHQAEARSEAVLWRAHDAQQELRGEETSALCARLWDRLDDADAFAAAAALEGLDRAATPDGSQGPLWAMHVRGPDDIYPAPSYEVALTWCDYINDTLAPRMPEGVLCSAVPALWSGSPEAHAADLPAAIQGWTQPLPAAPEGV